MRIFLISLISFLIFTGYGNAFAFGINPDSLKSPVNYPKPPATAERMFYVQRTPNANTIVYDLNLDSKGVPDADEPVRVYWIKYAERGQKEDLNFIQRKFAYGLNFKPLNNGGYDIRFVSYKKFPLALLKGTDGKYHIFAFISHKQAILKSIFVMVDGGSFWIPNILYVEIKGTDPGTGREMVERFKP